MFRFTLILLLVLTFPLRANLGETVAQCVARYGKPAGFTEANDKSPFGTVAFIAGGYALVIFLNETTEVGARVSKVDKSAFTPTEMQNIMAADSAGSSWISAPSDDPTCLRWIRADKATVLYDKEKHELMFTSEVMAKAIEAATAKPAAGK